MLKFKLAVYKSLPIRENTTVAGVVYPRPLDPNFAIGRPGRADLWQPWRPPATGSRLSLGRKVIPCHAAFILIKRPVFIARRWIIIIVRNVWKTAGPAPIPVPTANSAKAVSSGKSAGKRQKSGVKKSGRL